MKLGLRATLTLLVTYLLFWRAQNSGEHGKLEKYPNFSLQQNRKSESQVHGNLSFTIRDQIYRPLRARDFPSQRAHTHQTDMQTLSFINIVVNIITKYKENRV